MISITSWESNIGALGIFRAFLPMIPLFKAALRDWKHRELDASTWIPMILMGIFFLGAELATSLTWNIVLKIVITLIILLFPYFLHLYELGDAIAIISISLTHISTTKPILGGFFITTIFPDFGLTMLWNTELIMLLVASLETAYGLASSGRRKSLNLNAFPPYFCIVKEKDLSKASFLKREAPLVSFLLPGYVLTVLFGSIIPIPHLVPAMNT
ncbi:MAG: hypothetical protein RMI79_03150 [Nitrososphaerota archaeon]|nr:hypothetical protein [Nitrososphaerota archaeon]